MRNTVMAVRRQLEVQNKIVSDGVNPFHSQTNISQPSGKFARRHFDVDQIF